MTRPGSLHEHQREVTRRLQRRWTGPWRTTQHDIGPVNVTWRYRKHPDFDWLLFAVARQHVWHEIRNATLPLVRALARRLP